MPHQETQVGVAKVFAIPDAVVGSFTLTIESTDFEKKFKVDESKGQDGEVETMYASDVQYEVDINFMARGATRAAAESMASTLADLDPLTTVVLSGYKIAAINRTYLLVGAGKVKLVRDKECTMSMKLKVPKTNATSLTAGSIVG